MGGNVCLHHLKHTQTSACEEPSVSVQRITMQYVINTATRYVVSLPNEFQQYNGELQSSNRKYKLPICQKTESIESTQLYRALLLRRYHPSLAKKMQQSIESWTIPIEYKNSPFDKSIESKTVYEAIQTTAMISYLALANQMQQSNGKMNFSDRISNLSIRQIERIDRIDNSLWGSTTR